ncbi:MAG: hypothetical protein PHN56_03350 [Candidatus Nanoarchaeia archaeon]|nr:hypothetical protein [Candidatus Nanoarchaeia archaeon]
MKGIEHKIIGGIVFIVFYYFKLFPSIVNELLSNYLNIIIGLIIAIIFSGGRIKTKSFINFGLSPDNDFHKKKQRSIIFHSTLFPVLAIIALPYSWIYLTAFFYSLHILIDLLNPLSFEGKRHTYFLLFTSTILFFVMIYLI